eukprot:4337418-Pyramimonas_sp.AAC.1
MRATMRQHAASGLLRELKRARLTANGKTDRLVMQALSTTSGDDDDDGPSPTSSTRSPDSHVKEDCEVVRSMDMESNGDNERVHEERGVEKKDDTQENDDDKKETFVPPLALPYKDLSLIHI